MTLIKLGTLLAAALLVITGSAAAAPLSNPESWPYLPQCHQCANPVIFERTGIDTGAAKVLARVNRESALDYCQNFAPGKDPAQCASGVLEDLGDRIYSASADCETGELTDDSGDLYRVAGIWQDGLASGRQRFVDTEGETIQVGLHSAGLPLSTQWAVLCPTVQPAAETGFIPRGSAFDSIVGIDHNGSFMWPSEDLSVIYYEKPKASLAGIVESGQVLYRGDPFPTRPGRQVTGTAYTFRKNCDPAPYTVTGSATSDGTLVLRGASPVRAEGGCEVVGYTHDSGNATLVFTFHYGDI